MPDRYFRFPLALLSQFPGDPKATLLGILAWCIMDKAETSHSLYEEEDLLHSAQYTDPASFERLQPRNPSEYRALLGAFFFDVTIGSCATIVRDAALSRAYLASLPGKSATANTVSISTNWFWSCLNTLYQRPQVRTLSWREFRVLAALLSKIGAGKFNRCGWQEIQTRAAGWCGKSDRTKATQAEAARRQPLVLSRDQIRSTLARLEVDRFFARFQYNRAESWFSFSCGNNRNVLATWVGARKLRRSDTLHYLRADDQAASAKIREQKNRKAEPSTAPAATPRRSPTPASAAPASIPLVKPPTAATFPAPPRPQMPTTQSTTSSPPLTKNEDNKNDPNKLGTAVNNPGTIPKEKDKGELKNSLWENGYLYQGRFLPDDTAHLFVSQNPQLAQHITPLLKPAFRRGEEIREWKREDEKESPSPLHGTASDY